jgi:hypothetical protein
MPEIYECEFSFNFLLVVDRILGYCSNVYHLKNSKLL